MKTKGVSKFNYWASKPKKVQPTRTVQDVKSQEKVHRVEFASICCPCSGCDN